MTPDPLTTEAVQLVGIAGSFLGATFELELAGDESAARAD